MKIGTEDRKKLIVAGVLGFFAIFAGYYLYSSLFGGPTATPPSAPVVIDKSPASSTGTPTASSAGTAKGKSAVKIATIDGQLDPTLHMGAMLATESLVYTGSGRNIFGTGPAAAQAPVRLATANFPARPKTGPAVPVTPVNLGPPPPPPINLKFFGTATQKGVRHALLLSGDDVFLASVGDIVQRRYRIVSISATAITVEDVPNTNQQNLPLVVN